MTARQHLGQVKSRATRAADAASVRLGASWCRHMLTAQWYGGRDRCRSRLRTDTTERSNTNMSRRKQSHPKPIKGIWLHTLSTV